jgi:hypothetical protein
LRLQSIETINRRAREARIRQKKVVPRRRLCPACLHPRPPDFRKFHIEQARAFKVRLGTASNDRSGEPLSASTIHSTLAALKAFSAWLAQQRGYGSRVKLADA